MRQSILLKQTISFEIEDCLPQNLLSPLLNTLSQIQNQAKHL